MPGGRLTDEDRRRIEVWLAEGLGYAEIARRLGRPTSTVSREVVRNGVPGAYRADRAQRAADDRARRRRRPSRPADPAADERSAATGNDFVDDFAALLATTGMPRMTSRVFVCLLTADADGLPAADLVRRLRVSPASVSKSIAFLEDMELVARRPDPGSRRERYVIDDEVWLRAWQADTGAHGRVATAAERGVAIFGADSVAGVRLATMGRFFSRLSDEMSGSTLADSVVDDALTVVAALAQVGRPLTLGALTTALDWTRDRTAAALEAIRHHPDIADPLDLQPIDPDSYTITTRPDRLSRAQRQALGE